MEGMGKVWVLDTETKGTGATVRPLDAVLKRGGSADGPVFVPREPAPREAAGPAPRAPRAFKVVDLLTRETLVEHADVRATVAALDGRRGVDVSIFVWQPRHERWRALTLREERVLWDLRDRRAAAGGADGQAAAA